MLLGTLWRPGRGGQSQTNSDCQPIFFVIASSRKTQGDFRVTDVFISYARQQRDEAKALARDLTAQGYDVWWDHRLNYGDDIDETIRQRIAATKAVIVIWSAEAAASKWVKGEAGLAADQGKLISTKMPGFSIDHLPLAYRAVHTGNVDDRAGITRTLMARRVVAGGPRITPAEPVVVPHPALQSTVDKDGDVHGVGPVKRAVVRGSASKASRKVSG